MARRNSPKNQKNANNLGQALYWVAFVLLVVLGVRAPGWIKYVGWVLAAFFVIRAAAQMLGRK